MSVNPEYGSVVVERVLGVGMRIIDAPQRVKMTPEILSGGYVSFAGRGRIWLADQVIYQITGWDPQDNMLILELADDYRPKEQP